MRNIWQKSNKPNKIVSCNNSTVFERNLNAGKHTGAFQNVGKEVGRISQPGCK